MNRLKVADAVNVRKGKFKWEVAYRAPTSLRGEQALSIQEGSRLRKGKYDMTVEILRHETSFVSKFTCSIQLELIARVRNHSARNLGVEHYDDAMSFYDGSWNPPTIMGRGKVVDLPIKPKNKEKRQALYLKAKKAKESSKRDFRLRRKRDEAKNPKLRAERQKKNVPVTTERKRQWDDIDDVDEGASGIGKAVDVGVLKRRRIDHEMLDEAEGRGKKIEKAGLTEDKLKEKEVQEVQNMNGAETPADPAIAADAEASPNDHNDQQRSSRSDSSASNTEDEADDGSDDLESLLNESSADEDEDADEASGPAKKITQTPSTTHEPTPTPSTTASTTLSLIPETLAAKFPSLFHTPTTDPKILVTTTLHNSTIHIHAEHLTALFPNSTYVPRRRHAYKSHHFSLREISRFAANRGYTTLLVLNQDLKRPSGLTAVHLPHGPTLSFSISNWIPARALPGHGKPTNHYPELILNNFRTPLGLLTASFFRTLFPLRPELQGRQVVTLHNQRDYILLRRHRYVFREKRTSEKAVTDPTTGEKVKGMEGVKAGLQELGPRLTLKLRRVDKGIQRGSGQEWEWKARMEKERNKFQL